MEPAIIAHSLVAAHAERVAELADLYGLLERAVAAGGAESNAAREAHRLLSARIVEWETADQEAERRDVVWLGADEREGILRDIERALVHAERHAEGLPSTAQEHAVTSSLRRIQAVFPPTLTRAALVRFRRSAARGRSIEALNGPAFLLGSEAGVLLGALESASAPIAPGEVEFDPENRFRGSFAWGLEACVILEPGAAGAVDLGLGLSPAVPALLGVTGETLGELHERWVEAANPAHPFARYPYVPRGRFSSVSPTSPVRGDLDCTGPIGWAPAGEVAALARDLVAVAGKKTRFAPEHQAASSRVESAARRGHALIGFIEYVPPEREKWRKWLIDPESHIAG